MTRYKGPDQLEKDYLAGPFVRSGEIFVVSSDVEEKTRSLAERDGLLEGPDSLQNQPAEDRDGGFIYISKYSKVLDVLDIANDLNIPTTEEARTKTGELLERMHPGWEVRALKVTPYMELHSRR